MKFSRNLKLLVIAAISLSSFVLVYATSIDAPSQALVAESAQSDDRIFAPARMNEKRQFLNLDPERSSGSAAVRIAFMVRRFGTWFRSGADAPKRVDNDGEYLKRNRSEATITWVGHATLLVQMDGMNFLTDPIWSNTPSPVPFVGPRRWVAPGITLSALPPIDFVVISHNHFDHLDLPTLRDLAALRKETVFLVPTGNGQLLRDAGIESVREMNWGDVLTLKHVTVHCLPTQHWSKRSLTDTRKSLWASWAVTGSEKKFYFAGDTGYFSGFETIGARLGPFDLAAVPVGAYEPTEMMQGSHLNPEEAVQAALDVRAKSAVAIHYGTFDLSDEPLSDPPKRFKAAAANATTGELDGWTLNVGETRLF